MGVGTPLANGTDRAHIIDSFSLGLRRTGVSASGAAVFSQPTGLVF